MANTKSYSISLNEHESKALLKAAVDDEIENKNYRVGGITKVVDIHDGRISGCNQ